jgi:hypothetical protein
VVTSAPLPGPVASLRGGWGLLTDDPFGILLPTAGMLFVDAALASALRSVATGLPELVAGAVALSVARPFLQVPFVARVVATAARLAGRDAWPWGRPVALLGAELVIAPIVALAFGVPLVGGAAFAVAAGNEGWLATAAVGYALSAVVGAALALAVRAAFARVPWEVAVEGRSSMGALAASLRAAPVDAPTAFALSVFGDLLVGVSALACGALVLPGYPLVWLALAWRWGPRAAAEVS